LEQTEIAMKPDLSNNYVVRRRPDGRTTWSFQIYKNRLDEYLNTEGAYLSVICDLGTARQKVLNIPVAIVQEQVIPKVHCDHRGRFLFEVHKYDFTFNWHHSFKMEGRQFLS